VPLLTSNVIFQEMNEEKPKFIGDAKVLLYSAVDGRHKPTGACEHEVSGEKMGKAKWAAICNHESDNGYYLFFCYKAGVLSDTYHENLVEAKEQAEFEYEGISSTWEK